MTMNLGSHPSTIWLVEDNFLQGLLKGTLYEEPHIFVAVILKHDCSVASSTTLVGEGCTDSTLLNVSCAGSAATSQSLSVMQLPVFLPLGTIQSNSLFSSFSGKYQPIVDRNFKQLSNGDFMYKTFFFYFFNEKFYFKVNSSLLFVCFPGMYFLVVVLLWSIKIP